MFLSKLWRQKVTNVTILCVGLSVISSFAPMTALAWGDEGHKIVAKVAEHYLTDAARQRVLQLIKDDQKKDYYSKECPQAQTVADFMMCVSTWPDRVRSDRPETANWHFVDIPNRPPANTGSGYDAARDCQPTRDGDCVVRAIEQFQIILARREDKSERDRQRRIEALKFIIHFVGDMHQPLHSADNNDRGGNDVKVFWFGKEFVNPEKKYDWNLHSVWDTGIVERINPKTDEFAERLLGMLASKDVAVLQKGTVIDWANEAHKIALASVYDEKYLSKKVKNDAGVSKVDLGEDYYNAEKGVVDEQLAKAGVRLARVLNEALGW
jgi:hypothetical protein